MKAMRKSWWLLLLAAAMFVMTQCNSGDNGGNGGGHNGNKGRTWLEIPRFINNQLGDVSDGTTETCGGNALALIGDHCKNQLKGTMNAEMIRDLLRVASDIFDTDELLGLGDRNLLFRRGFKPQTADPCGEDLNINGIADYNEVCGGANQLTCAGQGNYNYTLDYILCAVNDGGDDYILDGSVQFETRKSGQNELLVIGSTDQYGEREALSGYTYWISGRIVRYQILNPVTGEPVIGSQRHYSDGMEIYKLEVNVDVDGDEAIDAGPYDLSMANDFEDGLVFLRGDGRAVYTWIDFDGVNLLIDFYDVDTPRNGNELGAAPGCQVQIPLASIDAVARTFDYTSTGDCLGNATDFTF